MDFSSPTDFQIISNVCFIRIDILESKFDRTILELSIIVEENF